MQPRSTYTRAESIAGVALVRVEREKVSDHEAPIVQAELLAAAEAHGHRLAVDLSQVALLASPGLGALLTTDRRCRDGGGRMAVFGAAPALMEVFRLTRLDRLLRFAPDRDAAVKAVQP